MLTAQGGPVVVRMFIGYRALACQRPQPSSSRCRSNSFPNRTIKIKVWWTLQSNSRSVMATPCCNGVSRLQADRGRRPALEWDSMDDSVSTIRPRAGRTHPSPHSYPYLVMTISILAQSKRSQTRAGHRPFDDLCECACDVDIRNIFGGLPSLYSRRDLLPSLRPELWQRESAQEGRFRISL